MSQVIDNRRSVFCLQGVTVFVLMVILGACRNTSANRQVAAEQEDIQAKTMLQGIWIDVESEDVAFMMKGDTIFYPDTISMPAYFKVVGDSFCVGSQREERYAIEKQTAHVFWFKNANGDYVKLVKSENVSDSLFFIPQKSQPVYMSKLVKHDTIVVYNNERFHCYVTINPTQYKVVTTNYNDDGMATSHVYYDNIIHLSVFQGNRKLFSSNFDKKAYARYVPATFLEGAILGNMKFSHVDNEGFHFDTRLSLPEGSMFYLLDTYVSQKGQVGISLK